MTPTTHNLWNLQSQLYDLMEERELIVANLRNVETGSCALDESDRLSGVEECRAELQAIDTAISGYIQTKVAEVSELRALYFALCDGAEMKEKAAKREHASALRLQTQAENLKRLISDCMNFLGETKFSSADGTFRVQGNGGKQPVEITDESLIPDEFRRVTMSLDLAFAKKLMVSLAQADWSDEEDWEVLHSAFNSGKTEISLSAVGDALVKSCDHCHGLPLAAPSRAIPGGEIEVTCPRCGGSGRAGVPGARLAERGQHLRIS